MIYLPSDALKVDIVASIYYDDKITEVVKTLSRDEIKAAIEDAEMNYMEDEDMFVLTEKGAQDLLERLAVENGEAK